MIIVRMTLLSANTGKETDLGTLVLCNDGTGTDARGNYTGRTIAKNAKPPILENSAVRKGYVFGHPRKAKSVWNLVCTMLTEMGYQ